MIFFSNFEPPYYYSTSLLGRMFATWSHVLNSLTWRSTWTWTDPKRRHHVTLHKKLKTGVAQAGSLQKVGMIRYVALNVCQFVFVVHILLQMINGWKPLQWWIFSLVSKTIIVVRSSQKRPWGQVLWSRNYINLFKRWRQSKDQAKTKTPVSLLVYPLLLTALLFSGT